MATSTPVLPVCLAYYCSGHGYGHATRVSAFTRHLLSGSSKDRPIVYIVSSAPAHVFSDSIACGARYRYAEIDPVIVQPLAYRVDRRQSVEVLKKFLDKKDELLERERKWLVEVKALSVLSDAAFLGCLAARAAGLPSILITNFSFDSVYSYLSTPLLDVAPKSHNIAPSILDMLPDVPIPYAELAPLVEQIHAGYRCADLLVRLPGYIPIPSFFVHPKLPSSEWIDVTSRRMQPEIIDHLHISANAPVLLPCLPPSVSRRNEKLTGVQRTVIDAPLLVRPPSVDLSVYTPEGRSKLLLSAGIPEHLHDPSRTKILIVSFGGQVFRPPPSRGSSRSHSRNASGEDIASLMMTTTSKLRSPNRSRDNAVKATGPGELIVDLSETKASFQENIPSPSPARLDLHIPATQNRCHEGRGLEGERISRLATPGHIWIPGAPPASKPLSTPITQLSSTMVIPTLHTIPPTPHEVESHPSFGKLEVHSHNYDTSPDDSNSSSGSSLESLGSGSDTDLDIGPQLLPDASWIAVVCGVSKEQWIKSQLEAGEDSAEEGLPEGFYVAPRDVYMPDLTAVGDVLLGKLGYGTVSECIDACTPFVYVSRPLFIEEHGLQFLLDQEGVGVELSRSSYEEGDWSCAVSKASERGKDMKERKREVMKLDSAAANKRDQEGKLLAGTVIDWVRDWWNAAMGSKEGSEDVVLVNV